MGRAFSFIIHCTGVRQSLLAENKQTGTPLGRKRDTNSWLFEPWLTDVQGDGPMIHDSFGTPESFVPLSIRFYFGGNFCAFAFFTTSVPILQFSGGVS